MEQQQCQTFLQQLAPAADVYSEDSLSYTSRISMKQHPFQSFLQEFVPIAARKLTQLNKAYWLLETTGSSDAADLKADLDTNFAFCSTIPKYMNNFSLGTEMPR